MQISKFADYGYRVLIYLAQSPERIVTMREISEFHGISLEHLRKVVHELSRQEFIETFKGKQGGLKLKRQPADILLGEVLVVMENRSPLIECAGKQPCRLAPGCRLEGYFREAEKEFYKVLDRYRLSDVIDSPAGTLNLFELR